MEISSKPGQYIEKWDYSTCFREYLLLLASKGSLGLESKDNFPQKIGLDDSWHEMLNKIRDKTADGKEYWGLIGFKEDRRNLWLPTMPVKGYDDSVSGELISEEINKAKEKCGIVDLLGNVHSHPAGYLIRAVQRFPSLNPYGLKTAFSVSDLYNVVNTNHFMPFMILVEGNYNLFVFRTRETKDFEVNFNFLKRGFFEDYWYEKRGFKYTVAGRIIPIPNSADPYGLNIDIAERHNLVLYQGVKGKDIKKIYPKK